MQLHITTNLATNKKVRIKSAQRLRRAAMEFDLEPAAIAPPRGPAPEEAAMATDTIGHAPANTVADSGTVAATSADLVPIAQAMKSAKAKANKVKKVSGLDAAYELLTCNIEPMRCGDIVDQLIENKMWQTNGKTPEGTLHSAIAREIKTKGAESRFKKTDRGLFTVNAK